MEVLPCALLFYYIFDPEEGDLIEKNRAKCVAMVHKGEYRFHLNSQEHVNESSADDEKSLEETGAYLA